MARTIRVTGKGRISVKPDTVRLHFKQTNLEMSYAEAVRASAEEKNELSAALEKLGFDRAQLKTLNFNVNTEYESYQTKERSWKRRFLGYRYTHSMKIEFPADNALLGRVLTAVSRLACRPEFSIEYTVADKEAAKNELLAKAVADSKAKAEVLSAAAGVTLQNVQTIDYSWGELDIVSRPVEPMMCCEAVPEIEERSISPDIEPDDIDVSDTVTVVWEIA